MFTPASFIGMWFRGLLAIAILGSSVYLFARWGQSLPAPSIPVPVAREDGNPRPKAADAATGESPPPQVVPDTDATFSERLANWQPGWDGPTALLAAAVALMLLSLGGRFTAIPRLLRRPGNDEPQQYRIGETRRLARPDGTELRVEFYGPPDAPRLLFTHGWGQDSASWYYVKRHLADRYRLILWDLPGHGRSTEAANKDYSMERLAHDLRSVLDVAGEEPVTLIGHSLGGMTTLTFCRLFPELLGSRVKSIILVHTTYTNPLHTTSMAWLYTALQKPLVEPLLHLTIWLQPLVWVMNWLSYQNGSAHYSSAQQSFGGGETRGQLDFVSRYIVQTPPAVLGRGGLGMLRYDARDVLSRITVPVVVVAADKDPVTLPEASQLMAKEIPQARLETFTPTKHLGFFEQNAEFTKLLQRIVPTTAPTRAPVPTEGRPVPQTS